MARFHVYRLKQDNVLVIDLQSDLLGDLKTRVMAPLYDQKEFNWSFPRLTPMFVIEGKTYVMATQRMAAVNVKEVGEQVADLSAQADAILNALDFLFQGF